MESLKIKSYTGEYEVVQKKDMHSLLEDIENFNFYIIDKNIYNLLKCMT